MEITYSNWQDTNIWEFNWYGNYYSNLQAAKDEFYIINKIALTTKDKETKLPKIIIAQFDTGYFDFIQEFQYKYYQFESLSAKLDPSYSRMNDFTYTDVVYLSIGVKLPNYIKDEHKSLYIFQSKASEYLFTNMLNEGYLFDIGRMHASELLKNYTFIKKLQF